MIGRRLWTSLRTRFIRVGRRAWREDAGATMVLVALATVPMLGAAGLAVDSALAYTLKSRMSKALDVAGLAAGRAIFTGNVQGDAQAFFDANFPSEYLGSTLNDLAVSVDDSNEFVTLEVSATMPTRFMQLLGKESVDVSARTVVQRLNRGLELSLVMDVTGSMRADAKIDAMKNAARDLVDILYGERETVPNVWVSVVPYAITVNIGPARTDWLDPTDQYFDNPDPFNPSDWKGCVMARAEPHDQDDTLPADELFTTYFYPSAVDNVWPAINEDNNAQNNGTGPNLGCGPVLTPLVAEKSTIVAAIDEMLPWHRGGTASNLGLSWGWRTLSPRWRGLWGGATPADMPLEYDDALMDKAVVLLTDGVNQFYDWPDHGPTGTGPRGSDFTSYGRLNDFGYATWQQARNELDERLTNTCTQMKALGVLIFTNTIGGAPDAQTQTVFRDCATSPADYYHSPDNATLAGVFHSIGEKLSNLRIVE